MSKRCWAGIVGLAMSLTSLAPLCALEIEISAGAIDRPAGTTLVSFLAPWGIDPLHMAMALKAEDGQRVLAQREASSTSLLCWLLEAPLAKGETRRYEVIPGAADESGITLVHCRAKDDDYELTLGETPLLLYNAGLKACPVDGFEACKRSGFIHPVYAPDGTVVTDDFPPEHPHQHGIMLAWVDTVFDGKATDFWNSMKNQGIVEHVDVSGTLDGPVYAELDVRLRHSQTVQPGAPRPVLDENWRIRAYNSASPRIIDIQSTIISSTDEPLHLKEYHYGGMAFRGAREWSFGKAEFLTSEGKDRETGNHTRPKWTAITGKLSGKDYTVVGVESPANFHYPQPVRLHPDMPYFCWSPTVLGAFDITRETPYVSKYRFFVFDGAPEPKVLDSLQANMARPLVAKVVE
jgi:hypothetical protein